MAAPKEQPAVKDNKKTGGKPVFLLTPKAPVCEVPISQGRRIQCVGFCGGGTKLFRVANPGTGAVCTAAAAGRVPVFFIAEEFNYDCGDDCRKEQTDNPG